MDEPSGFSSGYFKELSAPVADWTISKATRVHNLQNLSHLSTAVCHAVLCQALDHEPFLVPPSQVDRVTQRGSHRTFERPY
jgi:hypothetical protein